MKSIALAFLAIFCLALAPVVADAQSCNCNQQSLVQQIVQPQYQVQQVVAPIIQPVYQQAVVAPIVQRVRVQHVQQVQQVQVQRVVQPVVVQQQRAAVSVNVRGGLFGNRANIVVR